MLRRLKDIVARLCRPCRAAGGRVADRAAEDFFPGLFDSRICLQHLSWRYGHLSTETALAFLVSLERHLGAVHVFEFGTFTGRTACNLALNLSEDSRSCVYSLDLPASEVEQDNPAAPLEKHYRRTPLLRSLFREGKIDPEVLQKIKLLEGDSTRFDFSPYVGIMDLVFVDGGHAPEVVSLDSSNALRLLKPGGVIVWDDYSADWPGVRDFLDAFAAKAEIYRDPRSNLVYGKFENPQALIPDCTRQRRSL